MTQQPEKTPLARLFDLTGKAAVVTGGGLGIGRGIAARLAEAGARVAIADVNMDAARAAVSALTQGGGAAIAVRCDVQEESSIKDALAQTLDAYGRVDILVNNAGIYPFRPALEMTAEEWDRVQDINLRGTFLFSREFANQVVRQGGPGAIVNIGSIDSFHPSMAGLAAYDASKGGMLMLTRSMALEVARHGIRVNMIAPGGITTEGSSSGLGSMTPEQVQAMVQEFTARIPLGRMGAPDDIATVALFLASPASAYITGAALVVDGGRLLT
jgi:2-deoxy-D-gluconate 3-dehydrogenase